MYLGGALLLSLSMCLTSCEDVLGHWEKPTPNIPDFNVTSISLNKTSLDLFVEGGEKTATLTATLVGDPGNEKVEFSSEDDTRATVDPTTGEVTAVGGGEVTIYANIGPSLQAQCKVMVYDKLHDISTGAADIPAGKLWMITGTGDQKITIAELSSAYLKGVTITTTTDPCIETTGMGYIYLVDGTTNTMNATGAAKCAAVNTAAGPLTIYGQTEGTGKLIAKGGTGGAGIGGSLDKNSKAITILGGVIEATGGENAAGIGSGDCTASATGYTGGEITISGGEVTATGGANAAGIGTGYAHSYSSAVSPACGSITIGQKVIRVTATRVTSGLYPIGKGKAAGVNDQALCGVIRFDNEKVTDDNGDYTITTADGTYPHGGLTLAISGDTWTLTPTN